MSYSVISQSGNFSVSINDGYYCYICDCSYGNINVSLEDIDQYDGICYLFIRKDTNTNYSLTLTPYTGQLIDGNNSLSISISDKSYEIISYGGNWISHK